MSDFVRQHPVEADREHSTGELDGDLPEPECEECGHPLALHDDLYGCQFDRGDGVINECTIALGPCSCDAIDRLQAKLAKTYKRIRQTSDTAAIRRVNQQTKELLGRMGFQL